MPYSLVDMTLYFFIYSFCGWLMETVLCSIREHRFINRGFLNGPLCPIYGCGILLILTFLLPVRDSIPRAEAAVPVIFLAGAVLASAVEYFTSWAMEKLFHARWWDYSKHRFNLNGRICLSISAAWGLLATVFVYQIQPHFESLIAWLYRLSSWLPPIMAAVLLAALAVDMVISARIARTLGNKLEQLDKLGELIRAHLESLSLPSPEDIALRLENAYDQYEARRRTEREKRAAWRDMAREELTVWLRTRIRLLKTKTDSLQQWRFSQLRLLRAFPHLKEIQNRLNSSSQALDEEVTNDEERHSV